MTLSAACPDECGTGLSRATDGRIQQHRCTASAPTTSLRWKGQGAIRPDDPLCVSTPIVPTDAGPELRTRLRTSPRSLSPVAVPWRPTLPAESAGSPRTEDCAPSRCSPSGLGSRVFGPARRSTRAKRNSPACVPQLEATPELAREAPDSRRVCTPESRKFRSGDERHSRPRCPRHDRAFSVGKPTRVARSSGSVLALAINDLPESSGEF